MHQFQLSRDTKPQQMELWQTALTRAFGPFEVEPTHAQPLQGHVKIKRLAGFQFNDLHYQGQKLVRTAENLKSLDNAYYTFGLPLSGPLKVEQQGHQHQVGPGCVYLMNQSSAYTAIPLNHQGYRSLSISIPASIFLPKAKQLHDFYQLRLDHTPQAQLLADFIKNLFSGVSTWQEQQVAQLGNQLVDLIQLFMLDSPHAPDLGSVHLARAKNHIHQHFSLPALNAQHIAHAGNISTSYLYKLFADDGQPLQHYIYNQRLQHSLKLLANPHYAHLSIAQVATACGFSQAAHFSRRFKQHTGLSPLQYRKHAEG